MKDRTKYILVIKLCCVSYLVLFGFLGISNLFKNMLQDSNMHNSHISDKNYRYENIDSGLSSAVKSLNSYKRIDDTIVYLVLYRDDCKDCKVAEEDLAKAIVSTKIKGNNIILLNVNDMDNKHLNQFKKEYKDILYKGKVATPTVAKLKSKNKSWKIIKFNNTGDVKQQVEILKGV